MFKLVTVNIGYLYVCRFIYMNYGNTKYIKILDISLGFLKHTKN